jgi:uncharacterized protein (DUF4415 family)
VTENTITRMSLAEIRAKKDRGELIPNRPDAQPGEDLGPDFWKNAVVVNYNEPTSVHLKLDPLVFAYFKSQGKGHLTRMQDVLKAYVLTKMSEGDK